MENETKAFLYLLKRYNESKSTVALAVIKQAYHIKSDEYSKEGISLPILQLLMDSDIRFISKIKKDFIARAVGCNYMEKLNNML